MSEIATGYGSRILPRMYNGDEPESDATNQWKIQPRPPKGAWSIRKKYLGFMVTPQTTLALRHPLGKWKEESPRTLWKYHALSDRLYFQHSQVTTEYHRIRGTSGRSRNRGFVQAWEIDESPLRHGGHNDMVKRKYHLYVSIPREGTVSSINPVWYIRTVYRGSATIYMVISTHPLIYQVSRSGRCNQGSAIAISDGYHKNKWGTSSWRIMADTNESEQWAGLLVTPGRKDDQYALRSQIGGIYAMAVAIELICKFFHISNDQCSLEVTVKRLYTTYLIKTKNHSNNKFF
jgi:hypothetical protein